MSLKSILESLIFASERPLTMAQLKSLTGSSSAEPITEALTDLQAEYNQSGVQLIKVSSGYQFRTHPDNAEWVRKLLAGRPPRLTRAMLETLAIVAYRQPVTRPEVEDIRGVDCGGVLRILLERHLIRIVGKKEEPGRPLLYGTTKQFLEFFHLKDLKDLPTLKEFTELSEEHAEKVESEHGAPVVEAEAEGEGEGEGEAAQQEQQQDDADQVPVAPVAMLPEQDEEQDEALDALDSALDQVNVMARKHRRDEKVRKQAEQEQQPEGTDKDTDG